MKFNKHNRINNIIIAVFLTVVLSLGMSPTTFAYGAGELDPSGSVRDEGLYIINSVETSLYEEQCLPVILEIKSVLRNHLSLNGYNPDKIYIGHPFNIRNSIFLYFPVLDNADTILTFIVFNINTMRVMSGEGARGTFTAWLNESGKNGSYMMFADSYYNIYAVNDSENIMVQRSPFCDEGEDYNYDFRQDFINEINYSTEDSSMSNERHNAINIVEPILEIELNSQTIIESSSSLDAGYCINYNFPTVGQGIDFIDGRPNRRCGAACLTSILKARGKLPNNCSLEDAYNFINNLSCPWTVNYYGPAEEISSPYVADVLSNQGIPYSYQQTSVPSFYTIEDVINGGGAIYTIVVGGGINHALLTMGYEDSGGSFPSLYVYVMDPDAFGSYKYYSITYDGIFTYGGTANPISLHVRVY